MIPLKSRPEIRPTASARRRNKRFSGGALIGVGVTLAIMILAGGLFASRTMFSHAAPAPAWYHDRDDRVTTIGGLKKIQQIGSTATIVGRDGKQMSVDPNPYKITIAPHNSGILEAGDLLVSNFGNNDTGMSIVRFDGQKAPGRLFNTSIHDGLSGPSGMAFNNASNTLWVANSSGNDVLLFKSDGNVMATIKNNLFNGPWSMTTNSSRYDRDHNAKISFFTANDIDGKVLRIDVVPQRYGMPHFNVVQIGKLDTSGDKTFIDVQWVPSLRIGNRTWNDVLLALDPVHNRVVALSDSSDVRGMARWGVVFQGNPLKAPGGLALNPFNGDLLVVNTGDNNLIELNLTRGKVVAVKQIDPKQVDNQGNGAALFGILALKDRKGNLEVFFTDDNTNSLDLLSVS